MPILPRHKLDAETFERTTLEPPVGSGPYVVAKVDAGRSVTYRRNPDWWARDLPVTRGRFNFDEIRVEYFRDASSLFEAFKAGEIDVRPRTIPARWIEGYDFPAVKDGRVVKREFDTRLPSGMSALVFNTRRPMFADARVRRALHPPVRRRVDQPQPVRRRLQAHAELLRALGALLAAAGLPTRASARCSPPSPNTSSPRCSTARWRLPATDGSGDQPRQPARRPRAPHRGRLRARRRPPRSRVACPSPSSSWPRPASRSA